jgi:phage recombination protein Bet
VVEYREIKEEEIMTSQQLANLATKDKEHELVKFQTERGEVALSIAYVRSICPMVTAGEAWRYIQLCRYHRLNPYLGEMHIIKYDAKGSASMFPGKDAWTSRAEQHEKYEGFKAGIILAKGEKLEYRDSEFYLPGEVLVGGWCEVYRSDRETPIRCEVSLHEYNRQQAQWKDKPATMIRKVALVHSHREAFPSMFAGLYDQAEIGPDVELPEAVVVEGAANWIPGDIQNDEDWKPAQIPLEE